MTATPTTFRKKYTTCSGRDKPLRYPLMTIRSKQWYTKTSRLPNSLVNVSIGRPPQIRSRQHDHRSDGRWSQNFKYVWLGFLAELPVWLRCACSILQQDGDIFTISRFVRPYRPRIELRPKAVEA